jgi:hypothetical protein
MWPFKRKTQREFLSQSDTDLGNVLLKLNLVAQSDLDAALEHQRRIGGKLRLGELLLLADALNEKELAKALDVQTKMRSGHAAAVDAMLEIVTERSERVMSAMNGAPGALKKAG